MFPCFQWLRYTRAARWCIILTLLCTASGALNAQVDFEQFPPQPLPDTAAPLVPAYGFNLDEFSVGAYFGSRHRLGAGRMWEFADSLGVGIIEIRSGPQYIESRYDDTLIDGAAGRVNGRWRQRVFWSGRPWDQVGWGRMVSFFAFDSSESYYWPCKFLQRSGGRPDTNDAEHNYNYLTRLTTPVQERVYDQTNTALNDTVLKRMVMGYDPVYQKHRYLPPSNNYQNEDSAQHSGDHFFERHDLPFRGYSHQMWVAVKGHLFDPVNDTNFTGPVAGDDDVLFAVEIWNEIPRGNTWIDPAGDTLTTQTDRESLYATILVTKRDLLPAPPPQGQQPVWNAYRESVYRVNMVGSPNGGPGGPWNPAHTSRRFDIRIRWTGAEMAALRSVTLRDTMAQLVHGDDKDGRDFRAFLDSAVDYALRGHDPARFDTAYSTDPNGKLRTEQLVRFYSGDEGLYSRNNVYNYLDSLLYRRYPDSTLAGPDAAVIRGVRAWRAQNGTNPQQYVMTSQPEISVESYPHGMQLADVVSRTNPAAFHPRFGLPQHMWDVPTIAEHNGGRFHQPLLQLNGDAADRDSVELYSMTFNRMSIGANITGHLRYPFEATILSRLGPTAWAARRTGKRLIQWPGFSSLFLLWRRDTNFGENRIILDTILAHQPEASEYRAVVNLGMCYGSGGIHYGYIGSTYGQFEDSMTVEGRRYSRSYWADFGPLGPFTDEREERLTPCTLADRWDPGARYVIDDLWVGRASRLEEIRWLNTVWARTMGDTLRKLRWRDAYSMHYAVPQWYISTYAARVPASRPLPANEIVENIEAFDRWGRKDSATNTFVELGLFDVKKGATPLEDTNYVFVVNRRTFERPRDVAADTPRGRLMDSLAEYRRLVIRFNIQHPDQRAYNFIRVRSVAHDTTRLPGMNGPRAALDTVIFGDSSLVCDLRPGGAALLRITYCKPNERVDTGDLRFNSQRKIVFDGRRYHRVSFRKLRYWMPPAKTVPVEQEHIFYGRSLPVNTDTTDGAVRWDPRAQWSDVLVSDTTAAGICHSAHRFPSITVRADSSRVGDTVVSIVWTAHACDVQGGYAVLTRNLRVNGDAGTGPQKTTIDPIGVAMGTSDTIWGVPVVSRLHGGELFAWGDNINGIETRMRTHNNAPNWWQLPGTYSTEFTPTIDLAWSDGPGCYPSMPPFAHVWGRDSSVGLVWQQPRNVGSAGQGNSIMYQRMIHTPPQPGNNHLASLNRMSVSQTIGTHRHPSIDLIQWVWAAAPEGVTWQSSYQYIGGIKPQYRTNVHFSSLWTETSRACDTDTSHHTWRPHWDCIEPTWQWTYNTFIAGAKGGSAQDFYPSAGSLNACIDVEHQWDSNYFSIALTQAPGYPMQQMIVQYADHATEWPAPKRYLHGGYYPSSSASGWRQHTNEAVLYQKTAPTVGALETSRQFFAKERPKGYMAHGRTAHFRVSDTGTTTISGGIHDVWFASDAASGGVAMTERPESLRRTDSLLQVRELMRTERFTTHDSTLIGCELHGYFVGDSSLAEGMSVLFVAELVNASNDQAVAVLDSFRVAREADSVHCAIERMYDLLSGTYYVRLRLEPENVAVDTVGYTSLYPVEETAGWVEDEPLAKFRARAGAGSGLRIAVEPNPITTTATVTFSVPGTEPVTLAVFDMAGREMKRVVDGTVMEAGRYATEMDTRELAPGAYHVELRSGRNRASTKMMVVR